MSAFMVSREHLIYLVEAACSVALARGNDGVRWYHAKSWHGLSGGSDFNERAAVASMLRRENVASIEARYPDTIGHPENRPGVIGEPDGFSAMDFHSLGVLKIEPAQVMRACRCYDYQACEHDGWNDSEAKTFTDALYMAAAEALAEADARRKGLKIKWEMDELPLDTSGAVPLFGPRGLMR